MTQYAYEPYARVQQTNTLGIVGFICSLLGVVLSLGILCPIGVIISLIALGRQPRGFAIAGLIIGLFGSCFGLLFGIGILMLILAMVGVIAAIALSEPEKVELTSDMINIAIAVEKYKEANRYSPADLSVLALKEPLLVDPWGQRYRYDLKQEEPGWDVVSSGADKAFGTNDDVALSKIDETWQGVGRVHIGAEGEGGVVKIEVGDKKIDVRGDDEGGTVSIDLGDKTIELKGTNDGGTIDVTPAPPPATTPDVPSAPGQ